MSKRTTGVSLIAISSFLLAVRYLVAAVWGSSVTSYSTDLFRRMLQYTDGGLKIWSVLALIAGIAYLVWAECAEHRARGQE